jgi:hypothetical protein
MVGVGGGQQNRTNSESSAADPNHVVTPWGADGESEPFFLEAPPEGHGLDLETSIIITERSYLR